MNKISDRVSYLIIFIPWFILLLVFTFAMTGYNIFISLTDWKGVFPSYGWMGFKNYIGLPQMTGFWETLKNVGLLFGIGLPITVIVAVILAVFIDAVGKSIGGLFRGIAVASMALGGVTVGVFWSWMFNYQQGGINELFRLLKLDFLTTDWLGNPRVVMGAVVLMLMWKFVGYGALVVLGGLQGIPESHIEAAKLDGASTWQIYASVLIPQVIGHILTITLLLSMYLLKTFDYVFVLTGGGPGWASTLFPILVYRKMFGELDYAGGAAAATFMFVIASAIAIPYLLWSRREEAMLR
jgi:glucose/mannose transport system permease protein